MTETTTGAGPTCWVVAPIDPSATGAEGRLRCRLLELVALGHEGILLDLSACSQVPLGELHVVGELVTEFQSAPVVVRGLAPAPGLQDVLRQAGMVPAIPVVTRLTDVVSDVTTDGDAPEQAAFITFALGRDGGTAVELAALAAFGDRLRQVVRRLGGDLAACDVVADEAVCYLYGPDSQQLWRAAAPLADDAGLPVADVELRFGGLSAPHVHLPRSSRSGRSCL